MIKPGLVQTVTMSGFERIIEEIKVVQIYVEDGGHSPSRFLGHWRAAAHRNAIGKTELGTIPYSSPVRQHIDSLQCRTTLHALTEAYPNPTPRNASFRGNSLFGLPELRRVKDLLPIDLGSPNLKVQEFMLA